MLLLKYYLYNLKYTITIIFNKKIYYLEIKTNDVEKISTKLFFENEFIKKYFINKFALTDDENILINYIKILPFKYMKQIICCYSNNINNIKMCEKLYLNIINTYNDQEIIKLTNFYIFISKGIIIYYLIKELFYIIHVN